MFRPSCSSCEVEVLFDGFSVRVHGVGLVFCEGRGFFRGRFWEGVEFGRLLVIELLMSDDLDKLVSSDGKVWNSRKCYFLKRVGQFLKMSERVYMVRL